MNDYIIEIKEDAIPGQEQEPCLSVVRNFDKSNIWLIHVFEYGKTLPISSCDYFERVLGMKG